ncbi:glycosyl hydrolase family 28-related protein [Cohnella soli]|uniref:Glycosyl hydrolase family 28-related protein n=1 Tax=Cohnella soli TaxID=425005 RepID=A0ABW0HUX8_9BACL
MDRERDSSGNRAGEHKRIGRRQFLTGMVTAGAALIAGRWLKERLFDSGGAAEPAHIVVSRGEALFVTLADFGADPTGVTDSSDAFARALDYIEQATAANPAASVLEDHTRRGRARLIIPEGCYSISKPEALMRRSYRTRTLGLTIQGAGRGVTQIIYRNKAKNKYLLYNEDAWMFVSISDIEFISVEPGNNFMYSHASGGAQNYSFERCVWNGEWNDIFRLEGSNNNSEMTWYHCNFSGSIKRGVYVPAAGGSDQFLNYNFFACQFEVSAGDYLVFERGGNINVWGGSLIHTDKDQGGTFFKLLNGSHAFGVQRFLCIGARFEHRGPGSRLIECEWNDGTVSFISCDTASQSFRLAPVVNAVFTSANQKMPSILFHMCVLAGKHEYRYGSGSWNAPHNVAYENCEFSQAASAQDVIVWTSEPGVGKGGRPMIQFRNCRGANADAETAFFDSDLGYRNSNRAQLSRKVVSVKNSEGAFPAAGGQETFKLPLGAVILNIRIFCKQGEIKEGQAARYWLETAEPVPTELASVDVASGRDGFNVNQDTLFECDTDERRTIRLCAGAEVAEAVRAACCFVEYIG